jgi:hypothetical protein
LYILILSCPQFDYIGMDELLSMGERPDNDSFAEEPADGSGDPDAGESGSFNPLANLQKQYDEIVAMASMVQLKLADAAGAVPPPPREKARPPVEFALLLHVRSMTALPH